MSNEHIVETVLASWGTAVPRLLDIDNAAKYLGLPRGTVAALFQNSEIATTTIGKTRYTSVESLEDFVEHHGLKPSQSDHAKHGNRSISFDSNGVGTRRSRSDRR